MIACDYCDDCGAPLAKEEKARCRAIGEALCNDCQFDHLTPPLWPDLLLGAMEWWKLDTAT